MLHLLGCPEADTFDAQCLDCPDDSGLRSMHVTTGALEVGSLTSIWLSTLTYFVPFVGANMLESAHKGIKKPFRQLHVQHCDFAQK